MLSSWNLVKMIISWGNHFHQVSLGLDKHCGFFTNGQYLSVSGFFIQTLNSIIIRVLKIGLRSVENVLIVMTFMRFHYTNQTLLWDTITNHMPRKCDKTNISCISKGMETGKLNFSCQKNPVCMYYLEYVCIQGGIPCKNPFVLAFGSYFDDPLCTTKCVWQIMGLCTTWFWCGQNATFFDRLA